MNNLRNVKLMSSSTRYADEETLAYINRLRNALKKAQRILSDLTNADVIKSTTIINAYAQVIDAEQECRKVLEE